MVRQTKTGLIRTIFKANKQTLDPNGILNLGILIDPWTAPFDIYTS